MNERIILSVLVLLLSTCYHGNNNNLFNSNKLVGKYKVELTPYISEKVNHEEVETKTDKVSEGISRMLLSSVEIELSFYENQKGMMLFDRGYVDIVTDNNNKPIEKIKKFSYRVENDSTLYKKEVDEQEYKPWAIVRKFSENYDYLQFLIIEEGNDKVFYNLKKLNDKIIN